MRRLKLAAALLTCLCLSPAWTQAKPLRGGYGNVPSRYAAVNQTGRRMNRYRSNNLGINYGAYNYGGYGYGGYGGGVFVAPVYQNYYAPIWAGPQFYTPIFYYNFGY